MPQDELLQTEPAQGITTPIPVTCWCGCGEVTVVEVNLSTGKWKVRPPEPPAGYADLMAIVDHYKAVKGYDRLKTWDGSHRGRAMKAAKQILRFLRRTVDPVGLAKELIDETAEQMKKGGLSWTIETCFTRSAEWLANKQKD